MFLIEEKEEIARNRIIKEWDGHEVQVLNGRYGPYLSDGKLNGKIPKDREPASLTLEEAQQFLAETGKPARLRREEGGREEGGGERPRRRRRPPKGRPRKRRRKRPR